jgi:lipopolysaccharide cholinephosphotransferase
VIKRGTLFKERGLKKLSPTGIFIDIFPLDLSPQYSLPLEKKKLWINFISSIVWAKNSTDKGWKLLIAGLFSIRQLQRMMLCIMKSARKKGTTHYANFGSQYNLSKQTMPIEWYGEGVRMPFEDQLFIVPQEYNKVLTSIYGENYMSLPPEQKRRCHYPEKVVFSNGEEMAFENPIHIVTVKDQES